MRKARPRKESSPREEMRLVSSTHRSPRRAAKHPAVKPGDPGDELEHSEPRSGHEILGHEPDRSVLREADDETRVDHTPDALAHDQPRGDERAQALRTFGIRHGAGAAVVPPRQHGPD